MRKKEFLDYMEFLQEAKKNEAKIKSFNYHDGRLFSFSTSSYRYKFLISEKVFTPNKFVNELGFTGYNSFLNKRFSKLSEYLTNETDIKKWYSGYFGGLVGVNRHIVNDYVGNGEIFQFYDYDINKAYLTALTGWLPTKFVKVISVEDFNSLNEMDKIPFLFFFEIKLPVIKSDFLMAIGHIKEIYKSFDFLNSKQGAEIIVSEKRLSLINQIYFKDYQIKRVFVFERGKFTFYENILQRYCQVKDSYPESFKQDALRIYGTLGQIYKYKCDKLRFDKRGILMVNYKQVENLSSRPHVAMWVADTVAEKLFNLISANLDKIICWNTDGVTSTKPLSLKISKKCGDWKLKEFKGIPFLLNDTGSRLVFKNVVGGFIGATNIIEKDGDFFEQIELSYSSLKKGYLKIKRNFKIQKDLVFNEQNTFRSRIWRMRLIKEVVREYEQF